MTTTEDPAMTAPASTELLPCPFCGGEAERYDDGDTGSFNFGMSCITCKRCGASSPMHGDRKENLVDSWNTRQAASVERADALVDWTKPIETIPINNGELPRPARVLGVHKGAVDYIDVMIEGEDHRHPTGEYCAEKTSGCVRGTLIIRNVACPICKSEGYSDIEGCDHTKFERAEVAGEAVAWRWRYSERDTWQFCQPPYVPPREAFQERLYASPPRSEGVRASEVQSREAFAKIIYDAFPFSPYHGCAQKPEWTPGGNSFNQEEARRAADKILALGAAQASWMPIETAPKDGTEVLVWCDEGPDISQYGEREEDGSDSMGHDAGWWGTRQPMDPGRHMGNPEYFREAENQPWAWMPIEPPYDAEGEKLFATSSVPSAKPQTPSCGRKGGNCQCQQAAECIYSDLEPRADRGAGNYQTDGGQ